MNTLGWEVYSMAPVRYNGPESNGKVIANLVCGWVLDSNMVHDDMVGHACAGQYKVEHTALQWNEARSFLTTVAILSGKSSRAQREYMVTQRASARRMLLAAWRQKCVELDNNISQLHWEYEYTRGIRDATIDYVVDVAGDLVTRDELYAEWDYIVLENAE